MRKSAIDRPADLKSSQLPALSTDHRDLARGLPEIPDGLIEVHEAYQIGDLVFTAGWDLLSFAILSGQTLADRRLAIFSHVAICLAPALLVDAIPRDEKHEGGVRVYCVEDDVDCRFHQLSRRGFRALRLPGLDNARKQSIRAAILYYLGQAYSFRFLLTPHHTSGQMFCSQFVIQVLARAGITLKGITHPHKATPSAVFRAARAVDALDVTQLYRDVAERIERDPALRDAVAQDAVRASALSLAKIQLDVSSAAWTTYLCAHRLSTVLADNALILEQHSTEILRDASSTPRRVSSPPPSTDFWDEMGKAILGMRRVLVNSVAPDPRQMKWESGNWRSEHMNQFEVGDPPAYLRILGSVATRYSDEAGKQRDMLAEERESVGQLTALIAVAPADCLPMAQACVADNQALLMPFFRNAGFVVGMLDQPWQERPTRYPPKLAALADALQHKLDQLETNLRALWVAWLALLDDYKSLNAVIGDRLKEILTA